MNPKSKAKLVGPTWWCPVRDDDTADGTLAFNHVGRGGSLYVPITKAQNWCIEGRVRYGYARPLDGGFYAVVRAVRRPRLGVLAWLVKLEMLVEPSVVAGPFRGHVPDSAIIKDIRDNRCDEDDLYFEATLQDGKLTVCGFSGGKMEKLRLKADEASAPNSVDEPSSGVDDLGEGEPAHNPSKDFEE